MSAMDFVLTAGDNGKPFTLHPGNSGELRLPETPTTGYVWTVDCASSILAVGEGEFTPQHTGLGGGGERRWVIAAKTAGTSTLSLKRWREWEGDASVIERYQVTFNITPAPASS